VKPCSNHPPRAAGLLLAALLASASAACSSGEDPPQDKPLDLSPLGGDRPVDPYVPASYEHGTPAPLVILLHGFGAAGILQELVFRLKIVSDEQGFLYLTPDGTLNADGMRFWNATDACCDFGNTGVDDVAYLRDLVKEAKARFSVDPKRVYFVGHSNGGFMAYRMACDEAASVAAVASLAGSTWFDPAKCNPSEPVSVLQIHGTQDDTVLYDGMMGERNYPSAKATVVEWAERGGCDATPDTSAPNLDISADVDGAETKIERYTAGCDPGGGAELWTMLGEGHIPGTNDAFSPAIVDFLFAHPKP
jgi:polyhydroxybutyrate depolymerase